MGSFSLTATAIKLRFVPLVIFGWKELTNVTGSLNEQICLINYIQFFLQNLAECMDLQSRECLNC